MDQPPKPRTKNQDIQCTEWQISVLMGASSMRPSLIELKLAQIYVPHHTSTQSTIHSVGNPL